MPDDKIKQIADAADMIVRGYAFTKEGNLIRVFNTNDGLSAMVIAPDGTMVETNMDEMEQALVESIFFVRRDGSTVLKKKGVLTDREVHKIQLFIKEHYLEMYEVWRTDSDNGFYEGE